MDTKNHEKKSHFNLATGQFQFSKYKTIKGLYILNDVCWIFYQRSLIFKIFSKTDISLISFQQLDLIDMIFEIWDFIPEQEGLSNKKKTLIEFAKSVTKMTSTLLNTPWKVETAMGNTVDPEKEKRAHSAQLGGKERWLNEESVTGDNVF
jgi:hypothetical protein